MMIQKLNPKTNTNTKNLLREDQKGKFQTREFGIVANFTYVVIEGLFCGPNQKSCH